MPALSRVDTRIDADENQIQAGTQIIRKRQHRSSGNFTTAPEPIRNYGGVPLPFSAHTTLP
jgi:hypothetical protein